MSHVGIQRFASGHRQEDGAEDEEAAFVVVGEKSHGVKWIEGRQNVELPHDMNDAENGNHSEPQQHHRSEQRADPGGAESLHHEKDHQYDDGNRNDKR